MKAAEALLSEANRMQSSPNFNAVPVTQGLLETAYAKMKSVQVEMEAWQKGRAVLDGKRMEVIDNAKL